MRAGAAVIAFVYGKVLVFLRFAKFAHDGFGGVEEGRPQVHGHGDV